MKPKDEEYGSAPDLSAWISGAKDIRMQQAVEFDSGVKNPKAVKSIFESMVPYNPEFRGQFARARGDLIQDIGIDGVTIWVTLVTGELVFKFADPRVVISPHKDGKVIPYHEYNLEKLNEVTSYIPNNQALHSCILALLCENRSFEFLIEPMGAQTLSFEMTYQPFGNES